MTANPEEENMEDPQTEPELAPFEFEIELTAKTSDPGGLNGSFAAQLAEFGGTATLIRQTPPYRVDSSGTFWFEARRVYNILL